jgi:Protein of unknown function (DUF2808)
MRTFSFLSGLAIVIILGSAPLPFSSLPTQAVELQDGKTYFLLPPSLVNATTTENRVADSNASYFFTISIPEGAGEPLQRVEITQRDGSIASRLVQFEAENSRAFLGTRRDRGDQLQLGETRYDRETQTLSVAFESPVPPNSTVTLELRPKRNPLRDGIYLFGVTAYPSGADPYGQFLGYGRLQFDGSDSPFPF